MDWLLMSLMGHSRDHLLFLAFDCTCEGTLYCKTTSYHYYYPEYNHSLSLNCFFITFDQFSKKKKIQKESLDNIYLQYKGFYLQTHILAATDHCRSWQGTTRETPTGKVCQPPQWPHPNKNTFNPLYYYFPLYKLLSAHRRQNHILFFATVRL